MDDITSLQIKVDSTQVKSSATALNDLGKAGENAEKGIRNIEPASKAMSTALKAAAAAAAGLYASLQLIDKLKDISMLAARYETLGVVMKVVGNNVGYTGAEMEKYTQALQKNGIASIESRETLTKMASAHIDLAKANGLARIAQDAAVIGNTNSSEAFSRMIDGIQRGETEIMKTIGLNVDFMGSQQKLAKELGITTQQLTPMQKVLSNTNEAFRAGTSIAGSYEAAMGTAGKMANSLKRYIDDIKVSLGSAFGPAMTLLIDQLTQSLKTTDAQLKNNKKAVNEWGEDFRRTLIDLEIQIQGIAILIDLLGGTLTTAGKALFAFGNAIGNDNSEKQYTKMIDLNKMFEKRAIASAVAIEKLRYERDKDVDSIRELEKVEEDAKEATRMRLGLAAQLQTETNEEREKAEEAAAKVAKESAKLAKQAAKEYADFYQSTLDRLLPLIKEQEDYNKALAVLNDMDPTQSTEAYNTALTNLEKTLTVNIEKAEKLRIEIERLAENIQLGTIGPDELRNESAPEKIQQQNELVRLQEEYNEKVDKQVSLQKELGVAYGISANEAEKLKKAFASEQIMKEVAALEYITAFSGQDFGNEIADGINKAALSISKMNTMFEEQLKIQDKIKAKRDGITNSTILDANQRKKAIKELDDLESSMVSDQLSGYSNLFGTIGQMLDENSQARKNMHALEMAFAAAEIAINVQKAITSAVAAIANQGSGDPYTAFARIAAMVALMGGIIGMVGGSLSGGGSSSVKESGGNTATTGTVFGDDSASSESLRNATELLSEFEEKQYSELRGIHREMISLNSNITGLITGLIRSVGGEFTGGLVAESAGSYLGGMDAASINMMVDPLAYAISKPLSKIIPIVGDLYDGLSSLIGGILGGSTKTSITGSGIAVGSTTIGSILDGGSADAKQFQDVQTKKKGALFGLVGGSTKNRTVYQQANEEVTKLFTQVFADMGQTIVDLTKGLGGDLSVALSYAFSIPKLNLMGKTGTEITETVQAAISTAFDGAADAVLGNLVGKYQKVSEGMFETAVRVYTDQIIVLDALGKTGNATSGDLLELTQSIVTLAGGTNEFVAMFENYIELFTTEEQKFSANLKFLNESFTDINQTLPDSRNGFNNLISSLDLTTEAGRNGYVTMLTIADSADKYYSFLEEKATEELRIAEEKADELAEITAAAISKAAELAVRAAEKTISAAQSALSTAESNLRNSFAAEQTRIAETHKNILAELNAQLQLAQKNSSKLTSIMGNMRSALNSMSSSQDNNQFATAQATLANALRAARSGDLGPSEDLGNTLSILTRDNQEQYVQFSDYQRDFWKTYLSIAEIENIASQQQTDVEKTIALLEQQILDEDVRFTEQKNLLQNQLDVLLKIDNSILSIDQAKAAYSMAEKANSANSYYDKKFAQIQDIGKDGEIYNGIKVNSPAAVKAVFDQLGLSPMEHWLKWGKDEGLVMPEYAIGSNYVPYDMTAKVHKGEQITPKAFVDTQQKERQEMITVIKSMATEINSLRAEMRAQQESIAATNKKTAEILDKWDYDGMPAETIA